MRVVVAMTGASGAVHGARLLGASARMRVGTHLVPGRRAEAPPLRPGDDPGHPAPGGSR